MQGKKKKEEMGRNKGLTKKFNIQKKERGEKSKKQRILTNKEFT